MKEQDERALFLRLREYVTHKPGCLGDRCSFGPMKFRKVCLQPEGGAHPNHEYATNCTCGLAEALEAIDATP